MTQYIQNLFMGKEFPYWAELDARAEQLGVAPLIREIATLRAKVSFYESRIDEMRRFRTILEKKDE